MGLAVVALFPRVKVKPSRAPLVCKGRVLRVVADAAAEAVAEEAAEPVAEEAAEAEAATEFEEAEEE